MNKPEKVLYLDIETTTKYKDIDELKNNSNVEFELLLKKYNKTNKDKLLQEYYIEKATIFPSFSKIVCLSIGYYVNGKLNIKSFTNNEKDILNKSYKAFENASKGLYSVCGYYIKMFDIPWLNLKYLKYNIKIPKILNSINKKPWEVPVFDIYEELNAKYWSLSEISHELNINIPKYSGNDVYNMYYSNDINGVIEHCESDIKATAKIYKIIYNNIYNII